jgi:cellulose biosynthesis protein BcsQ
VLVVDCDPQANASSWLGVVNAGKGIYGTLCENGGLKAAICETSAAGVAIVPSSSWLVGAEKALAGEVGAETILRRKLKEVVKDYDLALIDTPPTLGVLTVGALVAADAVLVPCEAHVLALNGLAQLMQTIEAVRDMRAAGADVVEAHPFETRRQDKSDFNDLAQGQGLDAVRRRIEMVAIDAPSMAQRLVMVDEARVRIDARVGSSSTLRRNGMKETCRQFILLV